jgi:integrase
VATHKLTEVAIKKATFANGPKKRSDGHGLYLLLKENGAKYWRYTYAFGGSEKLLSFGVWPDVSLKEAREKHLVARKLLAQGVDPSAARRAAKEVTRVPDDTLEAIAREFLDIKRAEWSAPHATRWIERLEKDVFPWIGSKSLAEVTAPLLLQTLRRVEARGVRETVHSICQACGQVFRYGVATGRCERNPAADLRGALRPVLVKHMAAVVDPDGFGLLLRAIEDYRGSLVTRTALQLSALTFQRPGNLRAMKWADLQVQEPATWTIAAAEMKRSRYGKDNGRPHVVPLARQAVSQLREIWPLTGQGKYVFPSLQGQGRCMSENTINVALRRLGYAKDVHSAHGFRSTARTLIVERLNVAPDVVEAQLAHMKSGPLGSAYDRAEFLEQRRDMMQAWADYCDALRGGSNASGTKKKASMRGELSKSGHRIDDRAPAQLGVDPAR